MANSLGIYFGPKLISIVESKGKKIINYLKIPRSSLTESELEEKVPEDVKLIAVFTDELRKNKIDAKEVVVSLSGKDLIVRTFELPILPVSELVTAVNFEVKKYIPFKVEEIVSDFQVNIDKAANKSIVLFVGVKKDVLDKYLSIFKQLGVKVANIEYSAFSILRFLKLSAIGNKGMVALVSADSREEDEANFTVLDNGFPVFSRDISLGSTEEPAKTAELGDSSTGQLEKLKTEIRISLDFFNRKFPMKKIENIVFVADESYRYDLEFFMKEMELPFTFIDIFKYIGKAQFFSLSFIKGYGASLAKTIAGNLKLNFLSQRPKSKPIVSGLKSEGMGLLSGIKLDFRIVVLGLLICAGVFALSLSRIAAKQKEVDQIISARPVIKGVSAELSPEELAKTSSDYKNKITIIDNLLKKQAYLTTPLEVIAKSIPEDMSLKDFSLQKAKDGKNDLNLRGIVYLGDSEKELNLVNTFVAKLRENPSFTKLFKDIRIISVEQKDNGRVTVSNFNISCSGSR
ncbi:MAG: pilus assembly protein PilM [Candidatus Omnitrophica bacterium]|nr:pilus assembly protein PilM [Candidatus Omnitrophota bacterium]